MNSLKPLIENQEIRVDGHQLGTGELNNWDLSSYDIHMHKTTRTRINGKPVEVDIRIPVNSERPITYKVGQIKSPAAERKLGREIAAVLENRDAFRAMSDDLLEVLINYNSITRSEDKARSAIKRIAKHFGLLNKQKEKEIVEYIDGKYNKTTVVYKSAGHRYAAEINQKWLSIAEQENPTSNIASGL